jgi:2-keto-3-deoxy-L-fuconate dehydrogenase
LVKRNFAERPVSSDALICSGVHPALPRRFAQAFRNPFAEQCGHPASLQRSRNQFQKPVAFCCTGAKVFATDINSAARATLDGDKGITTRILDVLDSQVVDAVVAEIGPVDVLFNCTGFVHAGSILEASDKDFDFAVDINVRSMVRTIHAVLPFMLERGDGAMINIASVASSLKDVPNRFVHSLKKAAVLGLTKSVAADYVTKGIRCNAIRPGTVESPSFDGSLRATGDYDVAMKAFVARQPMQI